MAGPSSFSDFVDLLGRERVIERVSADPASTVDLFRLPTDRKPDRALRAELLNDLHRLGTKAAPVWASFALAVPIDELGFLEHVNRTGDEVALDVLQRVLDLAASRGEITSGRRARLTAILAPQLGRKRIRPLLELLLSDNWLLDSMFARELLAGVSAHAKERVWKSSIVGLPTPSLRRLLEIDRDTSVLPYAPQQVLARGLLTHADPWIAAWAKEATSSAGVVKRAEK